VRHLEDQFLESPGHSGPPTRPRFPSPEQLKTLPMPAEEGLRLDVDQSVLPCEEPREKDQRQPCSVGRPPRLDLALEVKGELFPEARIGERPEPERKV
jgi:hypothetical protein